MIKVFYTTSTHHLQSSIDLPIGLVEFKVFSDGELFVGINEEVRNEEVWVVAATNPPAKNILQTLLLLNALQRAGARINLLFTYFGYARQDKPEPGEAGSGQYIAELFNQFKLNKILIIHAHSPRLEQYLPFKSIMPYQLFNAPAHHVDAIASPDKGAWPLAQKIAQDCDKPVILIEKIRPKKEEVRTVKIMGEAKGKSILIVDDMISTGNTILHAATLLKEHGATSISVMATHNLMHQETIQRLDETDITRIFITNTIASRNQSPKITTIDIGPYIKTIIKESK
ncbi:MAG: ribose-phosphate diphosphokinase [Candidatus Babeliales bacterium]